MRKNYCCIGAYIDIEGLALVRFDLVDREFRILKTISETVPTYDKALERIDELSVCIATVSIVTIDVLSNFGSTLKSHILQHHRSDHPLRVKTTDVREQKEDMILNLLNIVNQGRIIPRENDLSINALAELRQIDKKTLRDVYDGNATLNSVLEAILHSVAWLESQMIKHDH